jgi:mycofactocin precursor
LPSEIREVSVPRYSSLSDEKFPAAEGAAPRDGQSATPAQLDATATSNDDSLVEGPLVEDTLVEEVSIDGMCGVY